MLLRLSLLAVLVMVLAVAATAAQDEPAAAVDRPQASTEQPPASEPAAAETAACQEDAGLDLGAPDPSWGGDGGQCNDLECSLACQMMGFYDGFCVSTTQCRCI